MSLDMCKCSGEGGKMQEKLVFPQVYAPSKGKILKFNKWK